MLLSHGREDPVVPFAASEEVQRRLAQAGTGGAELLAFNGGHTIDASVLPEIGSFVRQRLSAEG